MYGEVNTIVSEDSPMVFVQHRPEIKVLSPKMQSFPHVPDGQMHFRQVWMQR